MPHVHVHVLARLPGDDLLRVYPRKAAYPPLAELVRLAETIRAGLAG